ncbi:Putative beta-lactamase HcpC precursor [Pelagimonas phthalicica]|uniref:Putative beta-lactamase HcpC n=1 Tax=Pelagimonas phthalicica TaxID=1037362 RepID=A0A238JDY6_9RHOB|nr:trypsin-like peptidase domain-containing protein [Pelagimonas phthalicica]TDS91801.1 TPR repeat protein [Pelagimonas phthalicica]SMX28849.1 Putative beta-lactamase HcpC precursor [Pelagimonas phthalicica]
MRRIFLTTAITLFPAISAGQELMLFDASTFGDVVLRQNQSAMVGVELEAQIGSYNNEFIANYGTQSVFARAGRSVGRLDILTDKGHAPCTAFLLNDNRLMTNHHCVPGILENDRLGASAIISVQFKAGYVRDGIEEGVKTFHVNPQPLESSKDLDYSVLKLIGDANSEFGALELSAAEPISLAPLWIIGHPMGEAQRISREKCQADDPALASGRVRHTCDTLPGNSGSPVLDADSKQVVALHHAGSRAGAVNFAIPMRDILSQSQILRAVAKPSQRDDVDVAKLQAQLQALQAEREDAEAAIEAQRVAALAEQQALLNELRDLKAKRDDGDNSAKLEQELAALRAERERLKQEAEQRVQEALKLAGGVSVEEESQEILDAMLACYNEAAPSDYIDDIRPGLRFSGKTFSEVNSAKAKAACEKALSLVPDDPTAITLLGRAYDAEENYTKAIELYQRGADLGNTTAMNNLGAKFEQGSGVSRSYEKAFELYQQAASQGHVFATINLGVLYQHGKGVPQSDEKAVEYYQIAADQNSARAQANLGWMYEKGRGVRRSDELAAELYLKAAAQGYPRGQNNLGWMYETGRGVPQSVTEAVKWYHKAAEQGNVQAQLNLGHRYRDGFNGTQSHETSVMWFRKAADQGSARAKGSLGYAYEKGLGVDQSYERAVSLYRASAKAGTAFAQHNLAVMYRNGTGVTQSNKEALNWYRAAAHQGYAKSQYSIGIMYANGRGTRQSKKVAADWYEKAAEQGYAPAQNSLGVLYERGEGVNQSDLTAVRWYRQAANQGHARAQNNLGFFYENGRAVQKSPKKAVELYILALKGGRKWLVTNRDRSDWDPDTARAMQRELKKLGYYSGPIDGKIGNGTVSAMRKLLPG